MEMRETELIDELVSLINTSDIEPPKFIEHINDFGEVCNYSLDGCTMKEVVDYLFYLTQERDRIRVLIHLLEQYLGENNNEGNEQSDLQKAKSDNKSS